MLTSVNPSSTIQHNASASSHDLKTKDHAPTPPAYAFAAWIDGFGDLPPEERSALANPARDGIPNLLKYALDLDPTIPAHGADRAIVSVLESQNGRILELRVPDDLSRPDVHYVLETSQDLATWSPLAEAIGNTHFAPTSGAPVAALTRDGNIVRVSLNGQAPSRGFYRLTVTLIQ